MSRFRKQNSRYHDVRRLGNDSYELSWEVDRFVQGSRLRFPTGYSRHTDEAGARRFCKKWGLEFPEHKP